MAIRNRFQYEVATGRMTLPVAILIALLVWGSTCREWTELVSMALCAAGTYLLIELNTTFALIHTRTTLPSALFLTLYAFCPFLHAYTPAVWLPVLFLGILFALFQSYEAFYASTPVYHAFLLLGLGSLAIPPVLYLIPLIYIAMGDLRSFSARTFFAGLVGIATPYLFLLSYHLYLGNLESACDTKRCHKHLGIDTSIDSKLLTSTSRMVASMMNMPVQANKAIVGRNAFAHSSGIHQDGVLKNRESYEIIDPVDVGLDESVIALTARSGRAALSHRLDLLGFKLEQAELDEVYAKFLDLADKKKDIRDDDLLYLVGATTGEKITKRIKLKYLQILTGTLIPTATVILKIGGNERTATCTGNGPVDAAVKAIKTLINETVQITEFLIQAMNKGSDDVGRVHVQVRCGQMLVHGFSANTDVVKAAVEAFVDALNLLNATEKAE